MNVKKNYTIAVKMQHVLIQAAVISVLRVTGGMDGLLSVRSIKLMLHIMSNAHYVMVSKI